MNCGSLKRKPDLEDKHQPPKREHLSLSLTILSGIYCFDWAKVCLHLFTFIFLTPYLYILSITLPVHVNYKSLFTHNNKVNNGPWGTINIVQCLYTHVETGAEKADIFVSWICRKTLLYEKSRACICYSLSPGLHILVHVATLNIVHNICCQGARNIHGLC